MFKNLRGERCHGDDTFLKSREGVPTASRVNKKTLKMFGVGESQPPAACWGACFPTFGGPGSPQVINGSQDEPQGLLLLARHPQHLHGGLEFGELLRCSLLLLGLRRSKVKWR